MANYTILVLPTPMFTFLLPMLALRIFGPGWFGTVQKYRHHRYRYHAARCCFSLCAVLSFPSLLTDDGRCPIELACCIHILAAPTIYYLPLFFLILLTS